MIASDKIFIGADIGGSHISCAAVDMCSDKIIDSSYSRIEYSPNDKAETLLSKWALSLNKCYNSISDDKEIHLRIAIPGPFDYIKGVSQLTDVEKFDSLFGVNIDHFLKTQLDFTPCSCHYINDAAAFALYEAHFGGAKTYNNILALTLGTGFGSTFIQNRNVITKGRGIPNGGFLYNQNYKQTFADDYFSTRWFIRRWEEETGQKIKGVKQLAKLALESNKDAILLFEEFGKNLSEFISPYIKESQTECIILGGSIAKAAELFTRTTKQNFEKNGIPINVNLSVFNDHAAIIGAANYMRETKKEKHMTHRNTTQFIIPKSKPQSKWGEYDIYPTFPLKEGVLKEGFHSLAEWICDHTQIILDGYVGVSWDHFREELNQEIEKSGKKALWFDVSAALKSEDEINQMIKPYLGGEDPIFGKKCPLQLSEFFRNDLLDKFTPSREYISIIYGCGSSLAGWEAPLVYLDLPKNELQFRMRAGSALNLGSTQSLSTKSMYKRFYFVDWPVLNHFKEQLLPKIDLIVDEQRTDYPVWAEGSILRSTLHSMSENYFRVRPWFEPGPWGGQWIKECIEGLSPDVPNYAWSFELIVPENGLLLGDGDKMLEVSFDTLMFQSQKNILGEAAPVFGNEFPIRFDLLDTFDGGNLSIQCHPQPDYIKKEFGESFTQDETYYILDAKENAKVYLGFQDNIDTEAFKKDLEYSYNETKPIDIEKHVQIHDSKKHDLFLIPNGTVHGSGTNNLVLEISSTPYIFTFKMYDWLRLDLDGKPRPININRAFDNLHFDRKGQKIKDEFISKPLEIERGKDWELIHLPTHTDHFYDVHRYHFENEIEILCNNQCHVLMLVEGSSIILQTENGMEQRFSFAETFVIPAAAKSYKIINESNQKAILIKAFTKSEKC